MTALKVAATLVSNAVVVRARSAKIQGLAFVDARNPIFIDDCVLCAQFCQPSTDNNILERHTLNCSLKSN